MNIERSRMMSETSTRIVMLTLIIAILGCGGDNANRGGPQSSDSSTSDTTQSLVDKIMFRPECNERVWEALDTMPGLQAVSHADFMARREVALKKELGDDSLPQANEIHDCQPLIIPDQGKGHYGAFVTAFAHGKLNGNTNYTLRPVWVATITKSGEDYDDLNLREDKNCLFLFKPLSGNWRSWIVPTTRPNCATEPPPSTAPGGTDELEVHRADQAGAPYKPWGVRLIDTGSTYYVGLQCPGAWCVVGKNVDPTKIGVRDARGDYQRLAGRGG